MASSQTKKIALTAAAAALVLAAVFLVYHFSRKSPDSARAELLGFVPADATSVIFIDAAQLRASPFLAALYSWAPHPALDSEYRQFILDTGFDYERDLSRVFIAISNRGARSNTLVVAEGRFNRKKIEAYLGKTSPPVKPGAQAIFQIPSRESAKPAFFAFLSEDRVAISDSEDLSEISFAAAPAPVRAEWQTRFDRLSGSPLFAVIRQDPAIQYLAANQSPELAAFIAQLPWISLAARPDGDMLRVVAEGETITDTASSQLRDFLQGIEMLAQSGLDDAKLRQQMDPAERAAYIELLKGTEIEKIARGDAKSVRIVVPITAEFLKVAKIPPPGAAPSPSAEPPAAGNRKLSSRRDQPGKKK
jgi:hypothetical protein